MPRVSVIIPAYNHARFICETVQSVLRQTFTDYEIIVVNDGSPDNTREMLKPLVESGHIKYIEQSNAGQADARNRGLKEARGEFIAFLDDDDLWPSDKLEWQVMKLRQNPHACLIAGFARVFKDADQEICILNQGYLEITIARLCESNPLLSPGQALIRRCALAAVGGFRQEIWGADDWDLYFRLAHHGSQIIQDRLALHYRVHENNASHNTSKMITNCLTVIKENISDGFDTEKKRLEFLGNKMLLENYGPPIVRKCKNALWERKWQIAAECIPALKQFWRMIVAKPHLLRTVLVLLLPKRIRAVAWWLRRRFNFIKNQRNKNK